MKVINQATGRNQLSGPSQLGVGPVVVATGVIDLVKKIKPLKDLADKISSVLGLGGSDQDRLIKRYYEIKDFLRANGYDDGDNLGKWLDQYNIRKTDLKNNQKQAYWKAAYERLRQFTITWLNYVNPGLGNDYGNLFPEWKMVNEGQIHSAPIEAIKVIVKEFPRNSYLPGTLQQVLTNLPTQPAGPATAAPQNLVTKVIDGYTLVKDASGQIKEIRDAAGKLISPGDPRYSEVTNKDLEPNKAGVGGIIGGIVVGSVLFGMLFIPDKKKPVNGVSARASKKNSKKSS